MLVNMETDFQCLQPFELLPKQISDFKTEYIPQGLPMRTISALHRECERQRLSKFMNCHDGYFFINNTDTDTSY